MDQHRSPEQPVDRDRAVRRAGRLRRTLVGTSAAASLGIAAVLGISALDNASTSAAQSSTTSSTGRARRAAARPAPPGSSDQSSSTTAPNLSAGSGSANASTSGS